MDALISKLPMHSIDDARPCDRRRMSQTLRDVITTCRRSWAAADHYEALKAMSDDALAQRGIDRKDLARVAFDRLAEDE